MAESAAFSRIGRIGGARATTLNGDINDSATTTVGADLSSWAGGTTNGPITWTLDRGNAGEESGEATGISGNNLTGCTRGLFGTTAQSHTSGVALELTSSKRDFDEANYWVAELAGASNAAGDLPYSDGADSLARLAIGTARQQLAVNAGATAPEWVASLQSLLTTTGDLIIASAANTPARLAAGTSGYVLTSGGAGVAPSWAAAASGGPTVVHKSANESVTSSTTLQDDDHLTFVCPANTTRVGQVVLFVNLGDEAADLLYTMTTSTGSGRYGLHGLVTGITTDSGDLNAGSAAFGSNAAAGIDGALVTTLVLFFSVTAGVTDATVVYRWAQQNSSATPTTILAGSYLTHQGTA